jgi:hemerythrin superfamily protein
MDHIIPPEAVTAVLAGEHAHLERLFQSMVNGARCDDPPALRAQWTQFESELTAHLALEEAQILPAFAGQHPEEARGILDEHNRIRSLLTELGVELELHCLRSDRVSVFIDYLRDHARREEKLLYPWAGRQPESGILSGLRRALSELLARR